MRRKNDKHNYPCAHVALFVRDLNKMDRFYVKRLGFKVAKDYVTDANLIKSIFGFSSRCRIQFLTLGNFGVELLYFLDAQLKPYKIKTSGYNHWAIAVKNKESFCRKLKRKRVKVIKVPKEEHFVYFIQDPESNLIEVKEAAS